MWRGRERLTLLSELGIIVSVIQKPNLDPDARTVMGLLTPVSLPQPGGQKREEVKCHRVLHIYSLSVFVFSNHFCIVI